MPRSRVNDEASGFINDDKMLILEENLQRYVLWDKIGWNGRGNLNFNDRP
jgi:hypothetical protein